MEAPDIISGIETMAAANGHAARIAVSGLRQIKGGNSSDIWAFDGQWQEEGVVRSYHLILRRGMEQEFSLAGRGNEFRLLRALEGSAVPAPRVFWLDEDGTHLGRPAMVMERAAGEADRNLMTAQNRFGLNAPARAGIGGEIVDILADIHAFDVSQMTALDATQHVITASQQLTEYDAAIASLEAEPMLELRLASWWLWRHLPPPTEKLTIVHGDYRPANMLFKDGHITAVLDWEFAHIGDPAEDLGWYLSPYYAAEHLVPGHWSAAQVLKRYRERTASVIDTSSVKFWGVFAMYKLAYMTVAALRWLCDGDPGRMAASARGVLRPLLAAIAAPEASP